MPGLVPGSAPVGKTAVMDGTVALLLVGTLVVAAVDWMAVRADLRGLEYAAKPLTMVMLIAAVAAMDVDEPAARWCFLAALVLSLAGDVFLMLPDRDRWFVFGLGAFLLGHLAYVPGLWLLGTSALGLAAGLVVIVVAVATLGRRILAGVRSSSPQLAVPVTAYLVVISLMVVSAFGTGLGVAIAGAGLFYASDALIAWTTFIEDQPWGRLVIMVTYHLGQIGLTLSLVA